MNRTNRTSDPYLAQLLKLSRDKIKPQGAISGRLGFNVHPRVFYDAAFHDTEVHPRVFYDAMGGPGGTG